MGGQGSGRTLTDRWAPEKGTLAWERQSDESEPAWAAFAAYRDIEQGRTLVKAVQELGKKPSYLSTVEKWSSENHWRQRVEAWDAHKDKVSREAALDARRAAARDMVDRHLQISTHLQRLVSVEILRWVNKVGADVANPDMRRKPTLAPNQIQGLLDYAVKLERLNRNEPESITETRDKKMSHDELEDRIAHLLKAREG
jgi:hypothetical protein